MPRRSLLKMLGVYERMFPAETPVVDRIRRLVESHADCFERTCRPGHITASAWILSAERARCLLAHHRKLDKWLQLGGHADGQWDPLQVALREAREESGLRSLEFLPVLGGAIPLDVDVHQIPARYGQRGELLEDAHEHHDLRFLFWARREETIRVSRESHAVRWVTPEGIHPSDDFVERRLLDNIEPLNDRRGVEGVELEIPAEATDHDWEMTVESGPLEGLRYAIAKPLLIGRARDCDLALVSAHVSRHHARLTPREDSLLLEDLGSANGTLVNDEEVSGQRALHPGDIIRIKDISFRVRESFDHAQSLNSAMNQATVVKSNAPADAAPAEAGSEGSTR